ncbi:MAG TPA: GGDEF domain-containing protein, partial [Kineobactrum sp.]
DKLPMSLTIGDIDQFKRLNDTYGHQVGDEVLTEVAQRIEATLRNTDIVFRWGGEEFLCLHPATDLETAERVIERVRQALSGAPIGTTGGDMVVTMTFGVAAIGEDLTAAIQAADSAMYEGKRSGRNRTVVSEQAPGKHADPALVAQLPGAFNT